MTFSFFHLTGVVAVLASGFPACGGEYAILANGFRIHADRHEADGDVVRLHEGQGVTELTKSSISGFEPDGVESPPPPAKADAAPNAGAPTAAIRAPEALAADAARRYDLPEAFVRSVMRAESNFQPGAVSPKGATGLMQLMPETASRFGVDLLNPAQNADGGARYLRELLARYENDPRQVLLALAAYNAGPGAVEKYHGVPPYRETREYILRVLKEWQQPSRK